MSVISKLTKEDFEELNSPKDPNKPSLHNAYTVLVDGLFTRWYDIFAHLGISREMLDKSTKDHPFDAHLSLFDMVILWLHRKDPPATWRVLADVLRNKLLEGKAADKIERKYLSDPSNPPPQEEEKNSDEMDAMDIAAAIDDDSIEFTKVVCDIAEKLGRESYADLHHYITQIKCPDGTPLIDPETLKERRSPDGLLLPLIYTNLCTCRDVDMLIYLLRALNKEDILRLIQEYVPKVGMGIPSVRPVYDNDRFFSVKAILNPAIKHADLGVVSIIKHALCVAFGLDERPYLIQYIGWTTNPISFCFQVPFGCMHLVQDGIASCSHNLVSNGIEKLELEINKTFFPYNLRYAQASGAEAL